MNIQPGSSIGRYHIQEQLGEGGMATVYKAYDTRLEREVAIKVIRTGAFPPDVLDRILKRFDREAKSLARLNHPNIVGIIDYGEQDGTPYLVMPFYPAGTLKQCLGKPMPPAEAARLLAPVARALVYAHQQGILHRDVKPSNILITASGEPVLTDFGIAKLLEDDSGATLTGTGVGVGTPEYMAPEQGMGREIDGRADVYALGVVLYELVTGRKPYTADTPMAVIFKHLTDPLPRPKDTVPDLPERVEQIIFKAMAKKPEDRYPEMEIFAVTLESIAVGTVESFTTGKVKESIPSKTVYISQGVKSNFSQNNEIDSLPTVDKIISTSPRIKLTSNKIFTKWKVAIIIALMACFLLWGAGHIQSGKPNALNTPVITPQNLVMRTETVMVTPAILKPTEAIATPTPEPTLDAMKLKVTKLKTSLGGAVNKIAISPDGKQFAVATSWGLYIFDSYTLSEVSRYEISSWVNDVSYSPDGGMLVAGSDDGCDKLWDVTSGELLKNTYSGGRKVLSIAFSPDGKTLAAGRWNHTILLWNVENWDWLHEIKIGNGFAYNIVFSPNGQNLVAGISNDNAVMVWDVESGNKVLEIKNDGNLFDKVGVAYMPNGKAFASGTANNSIKLWNSENGSLIRILPGQGNVFAFSPDGHILASALMDKIQLWDVDNNVLLRTLDDNMNSIKSIIFSPDGQRIIAGSSTGDIYYWKLQDND